MIFTDQYIDGYKIIMSSQIGKGQYGKVYECQSIQNSFLSLCAKIIKVNSDKEQIYLGREKLISEIIQKNKLNQNIVKIFHVKAIPEEKKLIIIMEKCESNLQNLINEKNKFNDDELFDFLDQFLNGYLVLYNSDIMHRDIKPENILISKINGKTIYKLADFGIAKIYKANDFYLSQIGTPAYASPELNNLIENNDAYTCFQKLKNLQHSKSQVDIYSLGIILYQLVFGQVPFQLSRFGIIEFVKQIKANPLKIQGNFQYKEIIEKMLMYYPDQRMSFEYLYNFVKEKKQTKQTTPNQIKYEVKNYQQQFVPIFFPPKNDQRQTAIKQYQTPLQIVPPPPASISPHQKIKEYLQLLVNDNGEFIQDEVKNLFLFLLKGSTFSSDQLIQLIKLYKKKIENPICCERQTLIFFYCMLSLLKNPEFQNFQNFDDDKLKEEINKIYNNLQ